MNNQEVADFFSEKNANIESNDNLRELQIEGWRSAQKHFKNSTEHAVIQMHL